MASRDCAPLLGRKCIAQDRGLQRALSIPTGTSPILDTHAFTSPVVIESLELLKNGIIRVPTGPGFGITLDPAYVREAVRVTAT